MRNTYEKDIKQKMTEIKKDYEAIVIGGGPCGIAAAAELKKKGIESLIIEKGSVTESLRNYPRRMTFFSTAENIEIAGIPFPTSNVKATRIEALQYYRKVAQYFDLKFQLNTTVGKVEGEVGNFVVKTENHGDYTARFVVLATGYFGKPRLLNIPGENGLNVSHYYEEPFAHSFQKVVIVGGGNSAIEAALELYRHNVDVTMVVRGEGLKPTAKYWLVPDIQNRIKEGKIKVVYEAEAKAIRPGEIAIDTKNGEQTLPADFVYMLIGYLPDEKLLKACGLNPNPDDLILAYNPETLESEKEGLYLCGTILAGIRTERVFIENGRDHAIAIARDMAERVNAMPSDA